MDLYLSGYRIRTWKAVSTMERGDAPVSFSSVGYLKDTIKENLH